VFVAGLVVNNGIYGNGVSAYRVVHGVVTEAWERPDFDPEIQSVQYIGYHVRPRSDHFFDLVSPTGKGYREVVSLLFAEVLQGRGADTCDACGGTRRGRMLNSFGVWLDAPCPVCGDDK
jgi:hypothetical protein